jgi:T-complex protein 1 subunit alpha
MLVDNVGDMTITNDGATILSLLEVTHPAVCASLCFEDGN